MIDFRYHVVSLVSVFLALAVGIVLGAGPLREPITEALTGQVERLRVDRDSLRKQLTAADEKQSNQDAYLEAMAPQILGSTLPQVRVAIVALPVATQDDIDAVQSRLEQAGATVTTQMQLHESWINPERATFQRNLSTQLESYLETKVPADATTQNLLALAASQSLLLTGGNAKTLNDLLGGAEADLATYSQSSQLVAQAIVVVGPRNPEANATASGTTTVDAATAKQTEETYLGWGKALVQLGIPAVAVGEATTDTDFITVLRNNNVRITTVDTISATTAPLSVPTALAHSFNGKAPAYGFGKGAQEPAPTPQKVVPGASGTAPATTENQGVPTPDVG